MAPCCCSWNRVSLHEQSLDRRAELNKKGDGLLAVNGGDVRVAVEMSDSHRNGWSDYLRDTERNRDAVALLGIVR